MSTYIPKSKTYLEQYTEFMSAEKMFTVKFYEEYEGEGGYWNCYDKWVSGPTERDIVEEKTFSTIESALHYADAMQEWILNEEKTRAKRDDIYWMSEFNYNFHAKHNHQLIYAHINWCGSNYKMTLTYNIVEK